MRVLSTGVLALVLAAAPVAGAAQASGPPQEHRLRIGFGGGMEVPTSRAGDVFKTGVTGQGFLLINLGVLPAIRVNLGYSKFDYQDLVSGGAQGGNTQVLSAVAGMRVNLMRGPVRPYLLAGLGAFNVRSSAVDIEGGSVSQTATKFGIDGGAGVAFSLGRLDAFVEGRVQNVYTDQGFIDTKSIRTIPVTVGIIF